MRPRVFALTYLPWLISSTLTILVINYMLIRIKSPSLAQISPLDFNSKTNSADTSTWKDHGHLKFKVPKGKHILLPNYVLILGFSISVDDTNIYLFTQAENLAVILESSFFSPSLF